MERISLLGIPIDVTTQDDAIRRIGEFFRAEGQFHVATPNPEMLVEAQKNAQFRSVLQRTALNLADGVGLVWAMKKVTGHRSQVTGPATCDLQPVTPVRITGTDTMQTLCSPTPRLCPPRTHFSPRRCTRHCRESCGKTKREESFAKRNWHIFRITET